MSVTAPPRPPHRGNPIDREELQALVEALIEEARQRQRRRRRIYGAVAAVVTLVAVVVFTVFERAAQSRIASPASAEPSSPAAAPATSRIAFVAGVWKPHPQGSFMQTELYVMNADGSGMRRLVRSDWGSSPLWSPDGLKLAFEKRLGPITKVGGQCWVPVCNDEIFVMNADGSGQRNVTRNVGYDGVPAWSPDGQTIAFSSARDNSSIPTLYVMNADGSGQRRVTQDAADAWAPAWSPDGRRIAFVSYRDGHPAIYVMNADGTAQRKLTRTRHSEGSPAWSPDGRKIAFVRWPLTRLPRKWDRDNEVYVVNADGTGLRTLTRSPGRDGHPVWSPDGRTIGFVSNRGGNRDIYVMNADGSRLRNLTRGLHKQAFGIAWSRAHTK